jgi:hypothetical protein
LGVLYMDVGVIHPHTMGAGHLEAGPL